MSTLCKVCGSEETDLDAGPYCKICGHPFCQKCDKSDKPFSSNGENQDWCCKSCLENEEVLCVDTTSPYATPLPSPTLSLSSYGSCISSYADFPTDIDSLPRGDGSEELDTGQNYLTPGVTEHPEEHRNGNLFNSNNVQCTDTMSCLSGMRPAISVEEIISSKSSIVKNHQHENGESVEHQNNILGYLRSFTAGEGVDEPENAINRTGPFIANIETDPLIWIPPKPEDIEDEVESVANNDDDDYSDGTKWGHPSSLSSLDEENGKSRKEEHQKAMVEAMNRQLKFLSSRFQASEGISMSDGEYDKSWLNIVASLSWEAALLVKPDATEGTAMDPVSYVKVKCIASGARSQSQVIKGLVFKKNTAHKHMPTKFKNPRLLLLRGSLGHSAVSLSSFNSMEEENDYVKSIIEMIETCHPNLVLVEKSVSRDIQESLLAKGITLVFDLKLPRLKKIALCTGSQIVSSADFLVRPKLKQCDSFHTEKFLEEHNSFGESGKKLAKTLMFFEGCPKPLGCTILLKGARSDELKKVKHVMHDAIFMAYHLILEASFFADQKVFSTDKRGDCSSIEKRPPVGSCGAAPTSISFDHEGLETDLSVQPLRPGKLLSSVSASPKYLGDSLPPLANESICSSLNFKGEVQDSQDNNIAVSFPLEAHNHEKEVYVICNQGQPDGGTCNGKKAGFVSDLPNNNEQCSDCANKKAQTQNKDDIESVLDPRRILVLFSSQCVTKQIVCEHARLFGIKYYRNFDKSLGWFLQDILLNQKHSCSSCGEPPDSHVYRYTHQNGILTVLVRRLSHESILSGEAEGKIWMWTRCLKCERESGVSRSTQRVVMSSAARSLSFGKFLELSFSSHCASSRLSRCGHSFHRDSLRFFGSGTKVAMLRYSSVEIFAACEPPPVLKFYSPNGQEWLKREARDVLLKGDKLFIEVANILQKLKPIATSLRKAITVSASAKEFSEVEEMLVREKAEFEASLLKAINYPVQSGKNEHEVLGLNWLKQELVLELYVWDRRLRFILMCTKDGNTNNEECTHRESDEILCNKNVKENMAENSGTILEAHMGTPIDSEESPSSGSHQGQNKSFSETGLETESAELLVDTGVRNLESIDVGIADVGCTTDESSIPATKEQLASAPDQCNYSKLHDLSSLACKNIFEEVNIRLLDHMQEDTVAITAETKEHLERGTDSEFTTYGIVRGDELSSQEQHPDVCMPQDSKSSVLGDPEGWIWAPFSELRNTYIKDLHSGLPHKFEFISSYTLTYLSTIHQLVTQEMDWLHFPVGSGCNIISVSEDDISSIIACALALSEDWCGLMNNTVVKEGEGREEANKVIDNSCRLTSDGFSTSSNWSSTGSSESEGQRSLQSITSVLSDELSNSGSDGLDRLLASDDLHPDIPVMSAKTSGKSKYSVVCIHAKQFYALRRRCCPSEITYVSSLSCCRKWDAQGGKSKAFFAKSIDDRLIIKQIKKTELDSFLKFAPDYFKHISLSLDSGSQTCLAKILGIYQVRQNKNGKEVKTDLMVMENLLFGRHLSCIYDLKGAVFSRYVTDGNAPEKVLLDQNFVEDMHISPIYIGAKAKRLLQRGIWNDTSFLTSINVMDYSLLVGVDKKRHELVFGIIDYLRQYTLDKQLETWVKASLVVPKNSLPTIISPKEYKKRFRKFMAKYFLTISDSSS